MTKRYKNIYLLIALCLLTLALQSCLGIGGSKSSNFKTTSIGSGKPIGLSSDAKAVFQGKIYFTLNHNLYILDSQKNLHQVTRHLEVYDPAISPDGKTIAFIIRHPNYSDVATLSTSGGPITIVMSGKGQYVDNGAGNPPKSTANWYMQPSWESDGKHLLVLSDYQKASWSASQIGGYNSFILDLQAFRFAVADHNPADMQAVAYATIGDGGLRDAAYRPHHTDQIIYTSFKYDSSGIHQQVGLYLEDPNIIPNSSEATYHPGLTGVEVDPAVEITPNKNDLVNMEPTFSPDGNTIAYVRREDATHMGIYTMGVAANVTNNPNGTATAAQATKPYSHSVKLIDGQYVSQPVFSPDGKQMIYYNYTNGNFDIWLANVTKDAKTGAYKFTDTPIQLTDASGQLDGDSRPCWVG
ncbi:MAG TPA: hypothetical protein VHZ51_07625 [Ktedonobacteraceae bacterium]|nr:hypothetical protein [Ktedonobacteraceae bacterium]